MRTSTGQLDWLLVEFARDVPGVVHALVVSGDGLRLAASPSVGDALADQLSAAASGLVSLATGTAHLLGSGAVSQTILEMEGGYLFVTAISQGATLAVHAQRTCDIGMVGYEMTLLASRVGHALTPAPRTPAGR
ncbi:roadblock/LC7 domain-containing protein [Pseudonocardia ailaonensis]|uniref:Roadblock/LC7 domain-containing protein n=1 Tax=Pseudonocardia ailaonensis TaxID=367279 RepID=A0ABN2NNJ4_9PSEU